MSSRILLVAAMTLGAAACVGDVEDPNPANPNPNPNGETPSALAAKKMYEDNVYPIVQAACGDCHGTQAPAFVSATKDTAYNQIVGFVQLTGSWTNDTAGVYKVPPTASHAAVTAYTAAQLQSIADWLAAEASARAGGGGPTTPGEETPGAASSRLTKAFQACMSQADFTTTNFGPAIANQQSGQGGCVGCHILGENGLIANEATNPDLLPMYNVIKENPYFLAKYYTVNVVAKPYKMSFNTVGFDRVATRKFPHQNHPPFSMTGGNAAGVIAAKAFMDLTLARLDASGNCATPQTP
jgi:hypothetical protein